MIEWISVKDCLPEKEGEILVKINGKSFLGYSRRTQVIFYTEFANDKIQFQFQDLGFMKHHRWVMPEHFAPVSYWMYVPKAPND